jgi:hypothetical protein
LTPDAQGPLRATGFSQKFTHTRPFDDLVRSIQAIQVVLLTKSE